MDLGSGSKYDQASVDDLERLFREHHSMLTRAAYYIVKDLEASRDLVQDLFIKMWASPDKINDLDSPKAYLFTSIRNLSLNYLEKSGKESERNQAFMELRFDQNYDRGDRSSDEIRSLEKQISVAISELPTQCRVAFTLNRFEGLTNQEIATYLDISKRTVETQISKALKILRQKVQITR